MWVSCEIESEEKGGGAGWAGVHVCLRLCMWRAGEAACMPVCEPCLLR